ncbi:MAG: hypothetical protein KAR42_18185 [candidate division Zixibacteria bacterium]|nr:hypothetical protein [candidate division Zixibacteria bacterium]
MDISIIIMLMLAMIAFRRPTARFMVTVTIVTKMMALTMRIAIGEADEK